MDWQYVQQGLRLPISDAVIWSVLFPVTWLIYGLIAYHYFNHHLKAIFQGFIQTIVSYTVIAAITLFFHQWLGGSF